MSYSLPWSLVVACALLVSWAVAEPSARQGSFSALTVPSDPAAWDLSSAPAAEAQLKPGEMKAGVRLEFSRPSQDTIFRLRLKQPVALPQDARRVGLWMYTGARFWGEGIAVRFLLKDKEGVNYSYAEYGSQLKPGTWSYLECSRLRAGELGRLDETMILVEGGLQHRMPVAPVSLVGVELHTVGADWVAKTQMVELGPAFGDGLHRENSRLYWQCDLGDRYLFGDMDFARQPFVTAGDLLDQAGDYEIIWQARSAMYGRPVAQGSWQIPGYDASLTGRFQRLPMPLTARGQYWVTFKIMDRTAGRQKPAAFVETRIKVIRGDEARPPVLNADVRPLGALLVLNPQRQENTYAPGELARCVVRVWQPQTGSGGSLRLGVARAAYPAAQPGPEEYHPLVFAGADFVEVPLALELSDTHGMERLDLRLLDGDRELDRASQWVGRQTHPDTAAWTNREQLLRFADIFENGNHLLCCAEWDPRYTLNTDLAKFEAWVEDVKRQNVNTIELFPQWREVEPMPGVYWWDQVDARLDIIARHGLHAMINLDSTYVPAWMEEESQADEEGMVNGLWHGGGNAVLKSPSSPALWRDYGDYLTHLVLRYRNNPTLVAYSSLSIFFDHVWADHPWQGQYVDYSEAARLRFRSYLRDVRGLSLTDLSRRWGRPLASWNDIELPRTDLFLGLATIDRPDPRPEWRDFLDFRAWSQAAYVTGLVAGTVRKYDDLRPIGTHGVLADAQWYHQNGMFVCAGSSEGSLDSNKPFEFPKRAESIAMSFYTPYYTAMSMTNLLAQNNLNVQNFWMPQWRWDDCGRDDRKTGTQALAGWLALFQGELGKARPIQASSGEPAPALGLMYSRDSILYGVRSFHWPRLDDYRQLAERACTVPKTTVMQDVTAAELSKLPCVIVDPTARILPADTIQRLKAYVEGGGKLVLSPTSGMYASDAPAEAHALRRALGLPVPKSKWVTAAEYRQPGDYSPYYPFEVTGKGTPGEQSLSEPGQTAGAKPAATGIFRTTPRLVFRLGPYTMYNRDTWGDWAHMLPAFIYGRTHEDRVAGGTVEATWEDGGPAVTLHSVGKGQVLVLWGTPDWFNWRGALGEVAAWAAGGKTAVADTGPVPYTVSPQGFKGFILALGDTCWAVLRNESTGWTSVYGDAAKQAIATRAHGVIRLPGLSKASYRVRDITPLLSDGYDRTLTGAQLENDGIGVDLIPAESRIFRLDPVP